MGKRTILSITIIIALLLLSSSALASGFTDTYGLGSRAISLGGAVTAVADDFSAAYYNPAGLSQTNGHHLAIEYLYTMPNIDVKKANGADLVIYDILGKERTEPTEATAGNGLNLGIPVLGLIIDINDIAKLPINTQLGLAMSLPERMDILYRIHDYPPDQPHFIRYGDDIDRILIALGVGMEVVKDLVHIGVGTQAMLYGPGTYYIDGLSLAEENVVAQAEFGALLDYEPTAGLLITPLAKKLKIGISWRHEEEVQLGTIPVTAEVFVGGLVLTVPMILDINAFFTPEEYSFGIAYEFNRLLVSVEANKQRWSKYAYSITDNYYYSGDPDFEDTINYRLGAQYKASDKLIFTTGYCHQPSPVPDQSGKISNYLDMDKDTFSLGASYTLDPPFGITKEPVKIAGVVLYQKLEKLSVNKDGVSGPSWPNQESYTVEGNVLAAGISIGLAWK